MSALNGRLGNSHWDVGLHQSDLAFPGDDFKVNDCGDDIYYGVRVQLTLIEHIILSLEYAVLEFGTELGRLEPEHAINNITLVVGYKF